MSPPVAGGSRWRSRRTWVFVAVATVAVLVLAFVGLTLRLFVYPDLNAPQRSDAIVVLGGNGTAPRQTGLHLAREGYAPVIAISINGADTCVPFERAPTHGARVMCFRPFPSTTQGEARAIAHLASAYGWHRVIVVMQVTQATRARLRIGWCYPGQVLEVGSDPSGFVGWVQGVVYEWGALIKTLVVTNGC